MGYSIFSLEVHVVEKDGGPDDKTLHLNKKKFSDLQGFPKKVAPRDVSQ